MKMQILVAALLCCLAVPVFAEEAPEATAKRVKELEKANVVLQEDLARTQLELDNTKISLKKSQKALDEETAARKDLATRLDQEIAARKSLMDKLELAQKQLSDEIANKTGALGNDTNAKFDVMNKMLADMADKYTKEMAAMRDANDKQMVAMKEALEKERADRLAAEADAGKARAKLAKDGKSTRTIMTVLGVLLGGIAIAK